MAQHQSAKKRIRQNEKRRLRNRGYKSLLKTEIKKLTSIESKKEAEAQLRQVTSVLDKLVSKNILHKNTAANRKSQLARSVANLS